MISTRRMKVTSPRHSSQLLPDAEFCGASIVNPSPMRDSSGLPARPVASRLLTSWLSNIQAAATTSPQPRFVGVMAQACFATNSRYGLGLTGLALGFALRDILSNFVVGILLLWLRPFQSGDPVQVGDAEGTWKDRYFHVPEVNPAARLAAREALGNVRQWRKQDCYGPEGTAA